MITTIQIQLLIVCLVFLVVVCIVGTYACKIEKEEEELKRRHDYDYYE